MDDWHDVRVRVGAALGVAVLVWGLCLVVCVSLGSMLILRDGLSLPKLRATNTSISPGDTPLVRATSRATPSPAATAPSAPAPSPAATAAPAAPTPSPSATAPAAPTPSAATAPTRTPMPALTTTPTRDLAATPTLTATRMPTARAPTPTPSPTVPATVPPAPPTPIVCDSLDQVAQLTILPGQQFSCAIGQEDLTERINQQPEVPCTDVQVTFADGEIGLACSMGIRLQATGVVEVGNCRLSIRIVKGTIGFTQVVQGLIDQYAQLVPQDLVCVEEATVGDGDIEIRGFGR